MNFDTARQILQNLLTSLPLIPDKSVEDGWNREIIFDNFATTCEKEIPAREFLAKLGTSRNHQETIELVRTYFRWTPCSQTYKQNFRKRNDISSFCTQQVELALKDGDLRNALVHCNRAISYALPGREYHAAALHWKSIILFKLKDYKEAVSQLNLAFKCLNLSPKQLESMTQFKSECEQTLTKINCDLSLGGLSSSNEEEILARQKLVDHIFKIKEPNPSFPAVESFVRIKWNVELGRHLVATQDIPIGTTLLVEKPFAVTLNETLQLSALHCHHCLAKNFKCIPCPNCVFASFCNEKCMADAALYHNYECPCLPDVRSVLLNQNWFVESYAFLTFRIICTVGPQTLFQMFLKSETLSPDTQSFSESSPNTQNGVEHKTPKMYLSDSYDRICDLGEGGWNPHKERHGLPLISLMLTSILDENTNFFHHSHHTMAGDSKMPELKSEFRNFIAQVVLKHFYSFKNNAYGIGEFPQWSMVSLTDTLTGESLDWKNEPFACGIYSTASLLNHSCDVNVERVPGKSDGTLAFIAVKSIQEGEELVVSYGAKFHRMNKRERQKYLLSGYKFMCKCLACSNDWSMPESGEPLPIFPCCSKCSRKIWNSQKSNGRMSKYFLGPLTRFECPSCKFCYTKAEIYKGIDLQTKSLKVCKKLLMRNEPLKIIERLRCIMGFFENNAIPPSEEMVAAQTLYVTALSLIVHFSK